MSTLRTATISRHTGYIRSSCISKPRRSLPSGRLLRGIATTSVRYTSGLESIKNKAAEFLTKIDGSNRAKKAIVKQRKKERIAKAQDVDDETAHETRVPTEEEIANDKTVIRYFDQLDDGRIAPAEEEVDEGVVKEFTGHLEQLQRDVDNDDSNSPDTTETTEPEMLESTPADEAVLELLKQANPSLKLEDLKLKENMDEETAEMYTLVQKLKIPLHHFPEPQHEDLARLNEYLVVVAVQGPLPRIPLWQQFLKCRQVLCKKWSVVNKDCWDLLWLVITYEKSGSRRSMARLLLLKGDMEMAGYQLEDDRTLLCLEALSDLGKNELAREEWQSNRARLTFDEKTASQYWRIGSKILAHSGSIPQALDAAANHFASPVDQKDPTVLMNLIEAYALSKRAQSIQTAWALYMRLAYHFSGQMTLERFDSCIATFMKAERTDLAVAVFVDLMSEDKGARLQNYAKRSGMSGVENLESLLVSQRETAWEATQPPLGHPKAFQNKFFYSKLVKRMIGEGQTDWAAEVCALMAEREIPADPKVWNGIIGSWLRSGKPSKVEKAEEVAWQMIRERINFVRTRSSRPRLEGSVIRFEVSDSKHDHFSLKRIDSGSVLATSETFAVLAENYRVRQKSEHMKDLCDVIKQAAIQPTPDFMNSLLQFGHAIGRYDWMWSIYVQLTTEDHVKPNFDTFEVLWRACRLRGGSKGMESTFKTMEFPDHRTLFKVMVSWAARLRKTRANVPNSLPMEVYHAMIGAFGRANDQLGTGIVLYAVQYLFESYPDEAILRSIVLQLANTSKDPAIGFARRRRLNLNTDTKKRVVAITEIVNKFQADRDDVARANGEKTIRELKGPEWGEQMVLLLTEVLRHVVHHRANALGYGSSSFSDLAIEAGREMGVPMSKLPPKYGPD